jgi:PilZ domain
MFPLTALLSHAELTRRKSTNAEAVEARRAPRRTRYGNLTLFPRVEHPESMVPQVQYEEDPCVIASISNVSESGVGLILSEELPDGLEFDVEWPQGEYPVPLRFEVVHSRAMSAGMYRVGARLLIGVLPEEPLPTDFVSTEQPDEMDPNIEISNDSDSAESAAMVFAGGILKFEPNVPEQTDEKRSPSPAGTFRASSAHGFDKTETMDGVTTCGWERSVSIKRVGNRLWIYIHSPGKKNGWGIFVDPDQFESAFMRIQGAASSPFISTLAA